MQQLNNKSIKKTNDFYKNIVQLFVSIFAIKKSAQANFVVFFSNHFLRFIFCLNDEKMIKDECKYTPRSEKDKEKARIPV